MIEHGLGAAYRERFFLGYEDKKIYIWAVQTITAGKKLPDTSLLFERLDKSIIDAEVNKLSQQ